MTARPAPSPLLSPSLALRAALLAALALLGAGLEGVLLEMPE
jgi:hypothetical protein